ncbi:MAG: dihydrodipicolinate reductase C-terminal domain-containing protein [Acidobacteriaceae bacterium]
MKLLLLGSGKTGYLVAEIARRDGHEVDVLRSADNPGGAALTKERLAKTDVVIDFTTPAAVVANIQACASAGASMVVGTSGWYDQLPRVRQMVEKHGGAFVYGANFSIGINLFYEIAKTASAALQHGYFGQVFERHHATKMDAPSGTALVLQQVIQEASETKLEITSFREGAVVGMHELVLDSPSDTIYLCHDAKSRDGYAEGAVRAAKWLMGKKGFFRFDEIWRQL